jgi:WD40 repeat protein
MWRGESVSVGFNHRGDTLASSDWSGYTRLWEFGTGRELVGNYGVTGPIIGFRQDDLKLATGCGWVGTMLDLFEVAPGQGLETLYEVSEPARSGGGVPIVDKTGKLLAFRTEQGIRLYDFKTGQQVGSATLETNQCFAGFDKDGKNIFITGPEGLVRCPISKPDNQGLITTGESVLVSAECRGPAAISADGTICVAGHDYGDEDIRCQFFRMDNFTKQSETGVQLGMRYSALSPDGSLFASGAWQHPGVNVWDTKTGGRLKRLLDDTENRDSIATVVFSPDGRHLVTGTTFEYRVWEVGSWSLSRRIPQAPGNDWVPMMVFSRDGRILAGTHSRSKIRLHDAATGEVLADLEAPRSKEITGLVFNHDGTQLASCESSDALRLWDLRLIRRQLAELGLDWNQPPYPPVPENLATSR